MRRSPLWRGGGNAFPIRQRDYHKDMPVRMRREALKSAILSKILDKEIKVIDSLNYDAPKTKRFTTSLKKLGLDKGTCLVSSRSPVAALVKSIRNVQRVRVMESRNLNAYEVLKHKHFLVTKDILENLAEVVKA
jgi:large subunit ribosomal protein L4